MELKEFLRLQNKVMGVKEENIGKTIFIPSDCMLKESQLQEQLKKKITEHN